MQFMFAFAFFSVVVIVVIVYTSNIAHAHQIEELRIRLYALCRYNDAALLLLLMMMMKKKYGMRKIHSLVAFDGRSFGRLVCIIFIIDVSCMFVSEACGAPSIFIHLQNVYNTLHSQCYNIELSYECMYVSICIDVVYAMCFVRV